MKIAIGSDHAGYDYRLMLIEHLRAQGHEWWTAAARTDRAAIIPSMAARPRCCQKWRM